jgi:hypothetical protein
MTETQLMMFEMMLLPKYDLANAATTSDCTMTVGTGQAFATISEGNFS